MFLCEFCDSQKVLSILTCTGPGGSHNYSLASGSQGGGQDPSATPEGGEEMVRGEGRTCSPRRPCLCLAAPLPRRLQSPSACAAVHAGPSSLAQVRPPEARSKGTGGGGGNGGPWRKQCADGKQSLVRHAVTYEVHTKVKRKVKSELKVQIKTACS